MSSSPCAPATAPPSARRRWLWILLAALALIGAALAVVMLEDTPDVEAAAEAPPLPPVPVIPVEVGPARAQIRSFAQIRPLWIADLRANLAGQVIEVADQGLAGRRVAQGDLLVQLEKAHLQADLAAAEQAMAQADLALIQARNRTELRRREAERAGTRDPSDLTLLLPELRVAERAQTAAEAQVAAAQAALRHATITAPFDGVVTARHVSPGQSVAAGDPLLRLVDRSRFELETGLSEAQWALLAQPVTGQMVAVESLQGQPLAQARIRDGGGFHDPQTREFKLFLEVDRPAHLPADAQLLSGDLVQLVFSGQELARTLTLPEAALTREGHIWHLDADDRLLRLDAEPLWQADGMVTLRAPDGLNALRVAVTPLASFLPGAQVAPIPAPEAR